MDLAAPAAAVPARKGPSQEKRDQKKKKGGSPSISPFSLTSTISSRERVALRDALTKSAHVIVLCRWWWVVRISRRSNRTRKNKLTTTPWPRKHQKQVLFFSSLFYYVAI